MVTSELINYIKSEVSRGIEINFVINNLVQLGWSKEDVDQAVQQISNNTNKVNLIGSKKKLIFILAFVLCLVAIIFVAYVLIARRSLDGNEKSDIKVDQLITENSEFDLPREVKQELLDPSAYLDVENGFKIHLLKGYSLASGGLLVKTPIKEPIEADSIIFGYEKFEYSGDLDTYFKEFNLKVYGGDISNYEQITHEFSEENGVKTLKPKAEGLRPYSDDVAPYKVIENGRIKFGSQNAIIAMRAKNYATGNRFSFLGERLLLVEKNGFIYKLLYLVEHGDVDNVVAFQTKVLSLEKILDDSVESLLSFGFIDLNDYSPSNIDESKAAWVEKKIDVGANERMLGITFDYDFVPKEAGAAGFLRIYIDDKLQTQIDERYVFKGKKTKDVVLNLRVTEGEHKLRFRADNLRKQKSSVDFDNVQTIVSSTQQ